MPIYQGSDRRGHYFQWGSHKKYYYIPYSQRSKKLAKKKAIKQMLAAYYNGYSESQ